jgi:carotenoid cleavage dioxygenase-like enzyme
MTTTTDPHRPAPVTLTHHAHLSGVFAPQRDQVDVADLTITGELPSDLHGSYLRNGPNPRFDPIGSYVYPLDGDGMIHRITLDDGRASYSNRFVRTPMLELEEQRGEALWSGLTDGYTPSADIVGIAVIPRDGSLIRWIDTGPFWVWHFANAFDNTDGTITVDYVEHAYPAGFAHSTAPNQPALTRAICNPATGSVARTQISDRTGVEFPRIDDRLLSMAHDKVATLGKAADPTDQRTHLIFHDLTTGSETSWDPKVALGEPIYIPGNDNDYWGAIGTDPTDLRSRFYLLDVDNPADGPLATIELPHRVPVGLHGNWIATDLPH